MMIVLMLKGELLPRCELKQNAVPKKRYGVFKRGCGVIDAPLAKSGKVKHALRSMPLPFGSTIIAEV